MPTQEFTATTIAQLDAYIAMANEATGTAGGVFYQIDISGTLTESQSITSIDLHSNVYLTIDGSGGSTAVVNGSGQGSNGGFFVQSGNVTIQNLLVENTTSTGGAGGYGDSGGGYGINGGGGGGLGAGGGLFVASGATVTLDDVTFSGTSASGGSSDLNTSTGGGLNGGTGSGFGSGGTGGVGTANGGSGGFGGGGGGGGGAGSGGVSTDSSGGAGGFGGGSGLGGGFGTGGAGGGGAGMGGAVFVQSGGTLIVSGSGSETGASAVGGMGDNYGGPGKGFGQGYYLQGNGTSLTFAPGTGQTITIANEIADDTGSAAAAGYTGAASYTRGSGSLILNSFIDGNSTGASDYGTLVLSGANTYSGGTTIDTGILELDSASVEKGGMVVAAAAGTGAITFGPSSIVPVPEELELEHVAQPGNNGTFTNTLNEFGAGDSLDLAGLSYTSGGSATPLTVSGNTLSVTENKTTENFTLGSVPAGTTYYAHSDQAGGTLVNTVCFAAGTRIRTARGDVAVEALQVGDRVVTASGARRPVKWLGHRTMDCRRHPSPREAHPVRIRAHAFGPNRPARDLFLSPGHSVCVDFFGETLVPVGRLANGATIAQVEVDAVTYWHVELDAHDIILAENLACESYIDCGTRAFFAESDVVDLAALPDAPVLTTDDYCRPFHPEGALVDFARERLCLRANDLGWRLEVTDPLGGLRLEVDGQRVVPHCDGLVARITLPAAVRDIRLCSDSAVPAAIHGARDERRLGLQLAALVADDGLHWRREMSCTDERLVDGFHPHEGTLRWTDGRARLPAELWAGARDMFVLRLAFAGPALPRWVAPADAGSLETEAAAA